MSEVKERLRLITAGYGWHRSQWDKLHTNKKDFSKPADVVGICKLLLSSRIIL